MPFAIVTYGTRDGRSHRNQDPLLYASREEAQDEIADRIEVGDEAAREGRMRIEEVEEEGPPADSLEGSRD